jgi:hypothetical protein
MRTLLLLLSALAVLAASGCNVPGRVEAEIAARACAGTIAGGRA